MKVVIQLSTDMRTVNLLESATLVESTTDGAWKVRLISEGKGSSGIYPAETLEKYQSAFNGPVLSYENHPTMWEGPETRNFKQIVGQIKGETWIETDDRGKVGIYGNYYPDPDSKDRLERYKESLGLSIYIEGDGHEDEDGEFVVDSFNAMDPYKSVDVVLAAGRGGRFEESLKEMYSQRRAESDKPDTTSVQEGKETKMDKEEIEALVSKTVADTLTAYASAQDTKANEAAEESNTAVEAVEAYAKSVEAIDEADLFEEQVTSLRAEAMNGVDVTAKIVEAVAIKEAAIKRVTESADEKIVSRVYGSGSKVTDATELGKVF